MVVARGPDRNEHGVSYKRGEAMPQRDLDRVCNDTSVRLSEPDVGLTLLPTEDGVVVGGRAA
jgi:hypothetical protein